MNDEEFLLSYNSKTINEHELIEAIKGSYEEIVVCVRKLVDEGFLEPVIASKTNGRNPSLYNKYRIKKPQKNYSKTIEGIKLLHPNFDHQAYFDNPKLYENDESAILALSQYFWRHEKELEKPMSINERSFKIWGQEKYLKGHLETLGSFIKIRKPELSEGGPNERFQEMLNFYPTPEPFFDYIYEKNQVMNVLIIENKDTWYSMRKAFKDVGHNIIFGRPYHALLYGEGRKITRKMGRLEEYNEEILSDSSNSYYYFGDLDIEGLSIFQDLKKNNTTLSLELCSGLYCAMVNEAQQLLNDSNSPYKLPLTRDERGKSVKWDELLLGFSSEDLMFIKQILDAGYYIPQEILHYQNLIELMKGTAGDV